MAYHQVTSVDNTKLIIGNCKIETSASAAGTFVSLGAGKFNKFAHNVTKYDTQAGNAPDPLEGIADETVAADGEMIEFDASVMAAISSGIITKAAGGSGVTIINGGGNTTLTYRAYRFTNTRLINSVTDETIWLVFNATMDTGPQFTIKMDEDADPIAIMPFSITGKCDSTRTSGSQLYSITHTYNP